MLSYNIGGSRPGQYGANAAPASTFPSDLAVKSTFPGPVNILSGSQEQRAQLLSARTAETPVILDELSLFSFHLKYSRSSKGYYLIKNGVCVCVESEVCLIKLDSFFFTLPSLRDSHSHRNKS